MSSPSIGHNPPLVSGLTPVYNYGRYLARTLDSALAQDYPADRMEIVIVDDGSTDETPDVIAEYSAKHPERIRAFRQENQGFIAATNATFREARGELWAFLDSDDIWPPEKTREQVEIMRRRPEVGAVYSDTELVDPYDKVITPSVWTLYTQTPIVGGPGAMYRMCGEPSGNPALNSTIMLRAELAERFAPIPDGVPYVDWWVVARIARVAELAINESRVGYRTHGANITLGATGQRAVREVLKAVQMRRQLLLHGAGDDLTTEQLFMVWRVFEQAAVHTASIAQTVFLPLIPATEAEVERGRACAAEAESATRDGRYQDALRGRVMAVAANPWDADSREWLLDLGAFALANAEIEDHLTEARESVVLAFLDELENEPQLLAAYADVVGADDAITLVVDATDVEEAVALARVQQVIGEAGVDPASMPDALLVGKDANAPDKAVKVELERRAHAVLTRRPARLGVPAYSPERLGELKADLAARQGVAFRP
ncbi:MAG TPA: glycosyltransferase [Solirubrobacteraceae bacterium]|nr:glycosyltransferase [Solirubrobacteraceae bacterium]